MSDTMFIYTLTGKNDGYKGGGTPNAIWGNALRLD